MNKPSTPPPYFQRHIFFCTNQRDNGQRSCGDFDTEASMQYCKQKVIAAGLLGAGKVRVNKAGCLGRCLSGPIAVVYPEGVWYSWVDQTDIDDIVESHLKHGRIVERLLVDPMPTTTPAVITLPTDTTGNGTA